MSDLLTALRLVISGDSAGAVAALDKVAMASDTLGKKSDELAAKQEAAAASGHKGLMLMGAGAAITTGLILGTVSAYGKQAEAIIQVQKMTGASATWSSDFVAQAQALGVSADSVGTFVGRMAKNVQGYAQGTTKSTSAIGVAFKDLGISADSLKGKDAGAVIDTIREKLSQMPAGIERDYVMQSLFGRGAAGNPDLMRFLTATQGQLEAINKKAKEFGLVFSQKQLDDAKQFGEEMRMLKLEFEGIAVQLGRSFAPALVTVGKVLAVILSGFNHLPGPLKTFIALLPGVLLMAAGFVKVIRAVDTLRESTTMLNIVQSILKGKMVGTTVAEEGMTGAVGANTLAMKGNIVQLGLYGIAIGAAVLAIYKIEQAWRAAEDAAKQYAAAKVATDATIAQNKTQEAQFGSLPGAQTMQQIQTSRAQNAYQKPGVAGYAVDFAERASLIGQIGKVLGWFGEGGSFVASKPTVIGVGEKGTELVNITPLSKAGGRAGAGAGGHYFDFRGAHFSAHSPRELADQIGDVIMSRIVANTAGPNA